MSQINVIDPNADFSVESLCLYARRILRKYTEAEKRDETRQREISYLQKKLPYFWTPQDSYFWPRRTVYRLPPDRKVEKEMRHKVQRRIPQISIKKMEELAAHILQKGENGNDCQRQFIEENKKAIQNVCIAFYKKMLGKSGLRDSSLEMRVLENLLNVADRYGIQYMPSIVFERYERSHNHGIRRGRVLAEDESVHLPALIRGFKVAQRF
jgi:hypothetical protein